MGEGNRFGTDSPVGETGTGGTPLERVAAALGYPASAFTDGAAAEPLLDETLELLRLWTLVREPDAARRILAFVASVVAEQGSVGEQGSPPDA